MGPDIIPNEAFIETDNKTRQILLMTLHQIHKEEKNTQTVAARRNHQNIQGTKGKCFSERGIALASNTGKLFERIINYRIKKVMKMTETQVASTGSNTKKNRSAIYVMLCTMRTLVHSLNNFAFPN